MTTLALPDTKAAETVTFEEFLTRTDEGAAEWEDGKVIPMGSASEEHDALARFFASTGDSYLDMTEGGRVLAAPFTMKLVSSGREPDVLMIKQENLSRLKHTYLDGPTDVAVEIISPETADRDRGKKSLEYAAGKVKEYWIIDPSRQEMLFYTLNDAGVFQPIPLDADGIFRSIVLPKFALNVREFWKQPIPKTPGVVALVQRMLAT